MSAIPAFGAPIMKICGDATAALLPVPQNRCPTAFAVPDGPDAVCVNSTSNSNAPFVTDAVGVNAPVDAFSADSVPAVVVNQPPPLISSDFPTMKPPCAKNDLVSV